MFTKIKHSPLSDSSEFTPSNSITISNENVFFIKPRRGALIEVFGSYDGGTTWASMQSLGSAESATGIDMMIPDGLTHVNITSSTTKKVTVFPMENGFSFDSASPTAKYVMVGDALPSDEKTAMNTRLSALESTDLGYRPMFIVDHNISAGGTTTPSSDLAGLDGKSYIIYVDGKAVHPSLFSYSNDGSIQFSFAVGAGSSITAVAWE